MRGWRHGADDAGTGPVPREPGERVYVRPAIPESAYRSPDGSLRHMKAGRETPAPSSCGANSLPDGSLWPRRRGGTL